MALEHSSVHPASGATSNGDGVGVALTPHWRGTRLEAWQACDILCLSLDFDQPDGRRLMSQLQACGLDVRMGPEGIGEQGDCAVPQPSGELCILCTEANIHKSEIQVRIGRWRALLPHARLLLVELADASPGHVTAPSGSSVSDDHTVRRSEGVHRGGDVGRAPDQGVLDASGIAAILVEAEFVFRDGPLEMCDPEPAATKQGARNIYNGR